MMTDFRLEVFKTLAEKLNFTKTAEELNISQPAVSKHISELEKQSGGALFKRQRGQVSITTKGEILLDYTRKILNLYKELEEELIIPEKGVFSGKMVLGASTTLSQYVLPSLLAAFRKQYPEVQIRLENGNSEQIVQAVKSEKIPFGIIEDDFTETGMHYENFMQDEIVLVCSAALSNKKLKKYGYENTFGSGDLYKLPFVFRESGSGTLGVIDHALEHCGIKRKELNIQISLGSTESIKRYICGSECFAFISIAAITEELKENKLRIVEIRDLEIFRQFRFVSLHGYHSRNINAFKAFCLKHA